MGAGRGCNCPKFEQKIKKKYKLFSFLFSFFPSGFLFHPPGWQGPYTLNSVNPVTPEHWWCVAGMDEDPFLWRSDRGFHLIMHGMCPTGVLQAHYAFSKDAISWTTSPRCFFSLFFSISFFLFFLPICFCSCSDSFNFCSFFAGRHTRTR
jgi:hypothetical protein